MSDRTCNSALALLLLLGCGDDGKADDSAAHSDTSPEDDTNTDTDTDTDTGEATYQRCSDAPYVDVEMGYRGGCARHEDGCLDCWSGPVDTGDPWNWWNEEGLETRPDGSFQQMAVSAGCASDPDAGLTEYCVPPLGACALDGRGLPFCWGPPFEEFGAPSEELADVSVGFDHACGIDLNGAAVCWGACEFGACDAPSDHLIDIAAGHDFTCGLTTEGSVNCWGINTTLNDSCNGSCWDERNAALEAWQTGPFSHLLATPEFICGVQGTVISCLDYYYYLSWRGQPPQINVSFSQPVVSTAIIHGVFHVDAACALVADGSLACLPGVGDDDALLIEPTFTDWPLADISWGWWNLCGVSPEGELRCAFYGEDDAWCPYCTDVVVVE